MESIWNVHDKPCNIYLVRFVIYEVEILKDNFGGYLSTQVVET